jgi:hypothetical protein
VLPAKWALQLQKVLQKVPTGSFFNPTDTTGVHQLINEIKSNHPFADIEAVDYP